MKRNLTFLIGAVALALPLGAQDLPRPSPKATVSQVVGVTEVSLEYSRPAVRGREIWGGLVPWERVWRTGANEATSIEFSNDVTVEGRPLAAGRYSIHTIPRKDRWTVIFNSVAEPSGYRYDEATDVLRVEVTPQPIEHVERMTFSFPEVEDDQAVLALDWERLRLPLRIGVNTDEHVLASLRNLMDGPDDWRVGYRAAQWAFNSDIEGDEPMRWIDQSIARREHHVNLSLKARMQAAAGDRQAAIATARRAIELGRAAQPAADMSALERDMAAWQKNR